MIVSNHNKSIDELNTLRKKHYEATKHMTNAEYIEHINRESEKIKAVYFGVNAHVREGEDK